jgi:hypothetical protein
MKSLPVLILLCLLGTSLAFSQNSRHIAPDFEAIKAEIEDEESDMYYPVLLERFEDGDTSMTLDETRHFYFGYRFQEDYRPYGRPSKMDALMKVVKQKNHKKKHFKKIVSYASQVLKEEPLNINAMSYKLYALRKTNQPERYVQLFSQMRIVFDAISSTGDGLTKETAYHVVYVAHEYNMLDYLEYDFGGKQSLVYPCDLLNLAANDDGIEALYFDVSSCLSHLADLMKD